MKIDLGKISDVKGKKLLEDKVELSLYVAKKYLEKISTNFPNKSGSRAEFEMMVEGFLLFMISARDSLLQEINKRLSVPLNEHKVNLRDNAFQNQLTTDPDPKFTQIWNLIGDSIQQPSKVILATSPQFWAWDRTKSWLWEINALRNRIAHREINGQQIIPGSISLTTKLIVAELSAQPIVRLNNKTATVPINNPRAETIYEENPRDYFEYCFTKFEKLKQKIRSLL